MKRRGFKQTQLSDLVANLAGDLIAKNLAVLPDLLEPPNGPDHRNIFHSKDVYFKIEEWKSKIIENPSKDWQADIGLLMALSAYQSHIVLDSKTSKGVPDHRWIWKLLKAYQNRREN
jgi:hypothetical protein